VPVPDAASVGVGGEVVVGELAHAIRKALRLLDADEKHPSLRVHQLQGDLTGLWSASASDALRLTFVRTGQGRKTLVSCSRHYDR
jgi:hypothetical protein